MARTKNTEGKTRAKLKIVERPKVDDVPPSGDKFVTVEVVTSRKGIEGGAISKKRKKSGGDVNH